MPGHVHLLHCQILPAEVQRHLRLPAVGQRLGLVHRLHLPVPHPPVCVL